MSGDITDIQFESQFNRPLIAHFENGDLRPGDESKLHCKILADNEENNVCAVATDKLVYKGNIESQQTCTTILAVRNRNTNTVRLIAANTVRLAPFVSKSKKVEALPQQSTVAELNKQFGSKRAKRYTEQFEKTQIDIDNIEDEIKESVANIAITNNDLTAPTLKEEDVTYKPPINRNATTVDEIYSIDELVPLEKLDSLEDHALSYINEEANTDELCPFVKEKMMAVLKTPSPKQLLKCKLLLYVNYIIKFMQVPIKKLHSNSVICKESSLINKHILNNFTIKVGKNLQRPVSMRHKCTNYLIVLCLLALDYELDLEPLVPEVKFGVKQLLEFARLVGAQGLTKSNTKVVLKLPLPAPVSMMPHGRRLQKR